MNERRLRTLLSEFPFLLLGTYIISLLDPSLSQALSNAASNSPANTAFLWSFLAAFVGLHLEEIIVWLGWFAAVFDAIRD